MSISDNGVGFDTTNESNGNGLKNMEARMKAVDGRVSVKSAPGEGTTISFNGEVY